MMHILSSVYRAFEYGVAFIPLKANLKTICSPGWKVKSNAGEKDLEDMAFSILHT